MEKAEGYQTGLFRLFSGKEREWQLYEQAFAKMELAFPQARAKVGKSQVSFYGKHLFAAFSPPVRRKKDWPEHFLLVTFGLGGAAGFAPCGPGGGAVPRPLYPPCAGGAGGGAGRRAFFLFGYGLGVWGKQGERKQGASWEKMTPTAWR